jgi:Cd2+/Zn2+-exporting ATPase
VQPGAVDGQYAGCIVIADQVKEDAAQAINDLKSLGVKQTIMLTGDIAGVGNKIGTQLGLDQVYTELLPADKVHQFELLEKNKSAKGKLLYVGDGINDAPVLARADIGVAMGGLGSDAAIEAADIVIMNDEPSKVATAIKIAHRTRQIVYQNITLALGIKLIVLVLGALGMATMWGAVFADTGVALLAVFNSMRIIKSNNI